MKQNFLVFYATIPFSYFIHIEFNIFSFFFHFLFESIKNALIIIHPSPKFQCLGSRKRQKYEYLFKLELIESRKGLISRFSSERKKERKRRKEWKKKKFQKCNQKSTRMIKLINWQNDCHHKLNLMKISLSKWEF